MATASDIAEVRLNTNEPSNTPYTDVIIGEYIDALGVAGASAKIWRQKAALAVDESTKVTEAGASHDFKTHANALEQAKLYEAMAAGETVVTGPTVVDIVRET